MNYNELFRAMSAGALGWLWAVAGPAVPHGVVCTLMIVADVVSSRRMQRRLRRQVPAAQAARLRFSSTGLGRVVGTLSRTYAFLILAAMVDSVVAGATGALLKFASGVICFWQAWSILENEAAANDRPWARILRRILVDKTERYLGITLDELRKNDVKPTADR